MKRKVIALTTIIATVGLAACTNPDGTSNRTRTGAIIGGLTGATAGQVAGGDTRSTVIGGLLGAGAGAAVGHQLDAQARELQQSLGGTGAGITNTGSQLIVNLPEAITFPVDSAEVSPSVVPHIRSIAQSLQNYPTTTVQVVGHTDNTGSATYNQALSERRAQAVTNILVGAGTAPGRIQTSGRGLNQPIASNATPEGRTQNRRVEIIITPQA